MEFNVNASSFDVHDCFGLQFLVRFGATVWLRSLPMVRLLLKCGVPTFGASVAGSTGTVIDA